MAKKSGLFSIFACFLKRDLIYYFANFVMPPPPKSCKFAMRPRPQTTPQLQMFETLLEDLVDHKHPLVTLAKTIPWDVVCNPLEGQFSMFPSRPALPARLVIGSLYLKSMYDCSD